MPKRYEVTVEAVVKPSKWPKIIVGIVASLMIMCILLGAGTTAVVVNQNKQQATQTAINFPITISDARRIKCLDYYQGEQKMWAINEGIGPDVVCIVFKVTNNSLLLGEVFTGESSQLTDEPYGNPLFVYFDWNRCSYVLTVYSGAPETLACFENKDKVVDRLCLHAEISGMQNKQYVDMHQNICTNVVDQLNH
jgi:hypothetical protein